MTPWDDMAVVGRIARAHGNRGQVIVNPETDFPEQRFRIGSMLQVRRADAIETLTVESARFHRGRPILSLTGIETMNAAEELAGVELRVSLDELVPLPPGSFYHHELIGCSVVTPAGLDVGRVASVEGSSAGSRLVVDGAQGEILIPMVEGICAAIDVAARRIVVDPPDGLLELNVTTRK